MRRFVILTMAMAISVMTSAQRAALTDAEIQAILEDLGTGDEAVLSIGEAWKTNNTTGFHIDVWTPESWIRDHAKEARKQFLPFTLEDVTPDMRRYIWRVRALPSTPGHYRNPDQGSSVSHVVIRTRDESVVVHPLDKTPFDHVVYPGRELTYTGYDLIFDGNQVLEVWGPNRDQEFVITVIGPDKKKDFTIKKKHFDRLR